MKVVVAFTLDENQPSGGAKQLYRHVDILNAHGIEACIAHPTPGFRMDWFKNDTKVVCSKDIEMGPNDYLVFGEMVVDVPSIRGSERSHKVIIVQNPYGMFSGFNKDLGTMRNIYSSVAAVLCQSDYTESNVRYFFPAANVMRFQYSFDRPPFTYNENKEKILAYMTRKSGNISSAILTLIRLRRWPDGWIVAGMDGRKEDDVAEILRRSAVFLSMSMNEGFGMPPCFLPGQRVWTENGSIPIEAIKKRDMVVTHTGKIESVVVPMQRSVENEQIVSMKLSGLGNKLKMTKEHPIFSLKVYGHRPSWIRRFLSRDNKPEWNSAGSLVCGDYIVVPRIKFSQNVLFSVDLLEYGYIGSKFTNHSSRGISATQIAEDIGMSKGVVQNVLGGYGLDRVGKSTTNIVLNSANKLGWKKPSNPSSIMPLNENTGFFVGQYIAEGSCSSTGAIEFASHKKEYDIRNTLLKITKSVFGFRGSQSVIGNGARVWVCCKPLATALQNLCGRGAYHKFLPIRLMIHNQKFALGVIRGAWLGDGYMASEEGTWSYSTMSDKLAYDMRQALTLFGILSSVGKGNRGEYKVSVGGRARKLLSELLRLPISCKKRTGQSYIESEYGFLVPIRTIDRETYTGIVYNMEVTRESSYCVDGMASHNCEAMASGCAVVGFTGFAGDEYMLEPNVCWPVRDYDVLTAVQQLETVLTKDMSELTTTGKRASDFIRSKYSTEKEVFGIMTAWNKIVASKIEIQDDVSNKVKKEVAAYVPVHNEGPYLECLLKWLIKRVGAVFVCESSKPWCSGGETGGKSKEIVDKILAEVPEAAGILRYALVGEGKEIEPLKREAEQRNMMIPEIQKAGFKWIWMVEADEFYADREADKLWAWFFERVSKETRVVRCSWHTYWRSLHWRIEPPELFKPNIIFRSDCVFDSGRKMSQEDEANALETPSGVCVIRHYSWSRTPLDTQRKLAVWGHAKQLRSKWFEDVFMTWTPGCNMTDFHPINAEDYKRVVRCQLPIPEALSGHPFNGLDIIKDVEISSRKRIKAIIMHHDNPENADRLYKALAPVFDDVAIFDNGSSFDKVPIYTTEVRPNVYWTGTWNEVLATCSNYDAVWVLGCDVTLLNKPEEYRKAIEDSMPFGCWSPSVVGRAKPFMQADKFNGKAKKVRNIEGIAMAVSKDFMAKVKSLPEGNPLGYGQDLWMCYTARQNGQSNIIDGRVRINHPEGIGYDHAEAGRQMEETFTKLLGPAWREDFEYSDYYEYNLTKSERRQEMNKITIVTIDNGWGIPDFIQIVQKLENVRAIVMKKGVVSLTDTPGIETIPYELSLEGLLKEADVALFTKVGEANREDYTRLLKAGIPVVVHAAFAQGLIDHEKNGFIYQDNMWAIHWLNFLRNKEESQKIRDFWAVKKDDPIVEVKKNEVRNEIRVESNDSKNIPKVTVITPTFQRDPKIIKRCIDCMTLQTMPNWEQLVCSNGPEEPSVQGLVNWVKDNRVKYFNLGKDMPKGDFGNSARKAMLEKAVGEYVMFCDDDNIILPHYMKIMMDAIEKSGSDFAICWIMHFGPLNEAEVGKPPKVLTGEPVKLYHVDPLQVMVKREVMLKIGWDTEVGYLSDGVTLERLGKDFKHVTVGEVLGVHV